MLVLLMSLSLIGIIFVQAYYINNTVKNKEEQFSFSVKNALDFVAKAIEEKESRQYYYRYQNLISNTEQADSVAISNGIWFFPEGQSTGWKLYSILPVEEALFFLMTNLMVVQGYILFTQFSKKELPVKLGGRPFIP